MMHSRIAYPQDEESEPVREDSAITA